MQHGHCTELQLSIFWYLIISFLKRLLYGATTSSGQVRGHRLECLKSITQLNLSYHQTCSKIALPIFGPKSPSTVDSCRKYRYGRHRPEKVLQRVKMQEYSNTHRQRLYAKSPGTLALCHEAATERQKSAVKRVLRFFFWML